jgi:predicted RecB family nuclease
MLPPSIDLSSGTLLERAQRTEEAVKGGAALYQPVLLGRKAIGGADYAIVGSPDFFVAQRNGVSIRDSKVSRRIDEEHHPEILRQLSLYGWLFEETFGEAPAALEVHSGSGEIVDIPYDGGASALDALSEIVSFRLAASEPYEPFLWSVCGSCGFFAHCWEAALESRDVALLSGVSKGLAQVLRAGGTETIDQLVVGFDEAQLAEVKAPWGTGERRVGAASRTILARARAMASGNVVVLGKPTLPEAENWALFDVEGLPPHLDDVSKVYLWGLRVYGANPGEYRAATASFGADGDREGWEAFLDEAEAIFDRFGDIPLVHWSGYESGCLTRYVERFGDRSGIAARVRNNLLNLLPLVQKNVALPLPSYSLKVIEGHIGFERTQDEYGGDWSMAKYIEATETEDEAKRAEVMQQILDYNREDLDSTWAVLQWFREITA